MARPGQQGRQEGENLPSLHLQELEALEALVRRVRLPTVHHPQQPGVLLLYMGSQAPEGQGQLWSTHGFQQNLARQRNL